MKEYTVLSFVVFIISFVFGTIWEILFKFFKNGLFKKMHIKNSFIIYFVIVEVEKLEYIVQILYALGFLGLFIVLKFFGTFSRFKGFSHISILQKSHISKTLAIFKI